MKKIHDLAVAEITSAFAEIKNKTQGQHIYAFALGMVEDICGFFCAANTLEVLKEKSVSDSYPIWSPSEWSFSGNGESKVHNALMDIVSTLPDDDAYNTVRKDYENCLIDALKTCDSNQLFGTGEERDNISIFLHYADCFDKAMDNYSFKKINNPKWHESFCNRWEKDITEGNLTTIIIEKVKLL